MHQPLNTRTELAYNAASVAGRAVLSHWYRDRLPGGINNTWQLVKQLLVLCITLYLSQLLTKWRWHTITTNSSSSSSSSSSSASRAQGLTGGGGTTAAGCGVGFASPMNNRKGDMVEAAEESEGLGMAALGDDDGWQGARQPEKAYSVAGKAAAATGGVVEFRPAALSPRRQQGAGVSRPDLDCAVVPEPGCGTALRMSRPAADGTDFHNGVDADLIASGEARQELPQSPVALPRYAPFIRRHTLLFKIPWAEPEQLPPGYEQRLRDLVADRGYNMAAVYVRKGCVELTMVLEERGERSRGHCVADCRELRNDSHLGVEAVVEALGLMHLAEDPAEPNVGGRTIEGAMHPVAGAHASRPLPRLSQVEVKMVGMDYEEGVLGTPGSGQELPADCLASRTTPGAAHGYSCDCGFRMSSVCSCRKRRCVRAHRWTEHPNSVIELWGPAAARSGVTW
ncbi:hypothetical protein Vretimale_8712 [Volvox reticuliferus]|uniref:Uncharacterized protein n=1 Tax=Volvox reticuliferus TaxID=1737510 RepID=A0A8J4LPL7_9CHLO|nr:hypothetical protein Vretifemale_6284 [Volvox reticuliferus]GIM04088.1 hypothetical protein Vretimale_8712 [Volvox reticuliferus]